jgi:zinc protease
MSRNLLFGFSFGIVSAIFAAPALADNVTTFTLDNGLQAIVIEDHRAPVVTHMMWYKIGSADEPRGKSGIAHFLEHLMFKGTNTIAPGEFSAVVEAQSGSDNAFTFYDYTAYFQRVAADRLDLMMTMEADRMRGLILSEDDVITERAVIVEERAQRTDSDPGALFGEQRRAAQYLNHPYGTPVIGWKHEAEALTRNDALSFYREFYAPNNAILIVAGDVNPAEVKVLAEKHYGPVAATPDLAPRQRVTEPPQLAERRLTMVDPRVAQPYVLRTYLAPERDAGAQKQAAALTVLAELLGGSGTTSVLARALQFGDAPKAVYTSAFYDGMSLDVTSFGFVAVPTPDTNLTEIEAAMDAVIAQFMQDGIDAAAFERIKRQLRADEIYARDNIEGLARLYGSALTSGLTVADVQAWPQVLQDVTPEHVMEAARLVFDRKNAVTGWLQRGDPAMTEGGL